jgi:lysyl endopeptidase
MRRTALLMMGLSTLLALTSAAGAASAAEWRYPAIASWSPLRHAVTLMPAGTSRHAGTVRDAATSRDAGTPSAQRTAEETPDMVGTVESVTGGALGDRPSMTLHHPGADYVKVHFARLSMLPGDKLTVADPSGRESHTYAEKDLREADGWAMSISGDSAVVTAETATNDALELRSRLSTLSVTVDKIARGLTPDEKAANEKAAGAEAARHAATQTSAREESICGRSDEKVDAACYKSSDPVAYAHSRPVARLLIGGVELCTGWRVGPNNRMFTNHHCFSQTRDARNTEVWFNYECGQCGGLNPLRPTKVWGDRVLATDPTLDYTLFSVQNFDTLRQFGFLTLDVRQPNRGEELYIPQHPRGDPTVIAMEDPGERSGNCAVANPSFAGYDTNTDVSYYCDTEGGSSGSPVISRNTNEVIALHHFGGCPNSGVRVDLIYREIRNLL